MHTTMSGSLKILGPEDLLPKEEMKIEEEVLGT
jgi:hypothetical protein